LGGSGDGVCGCGRLLVLCTGTGDSVVVAGFL